MFKFIKRHGVKFYISLIIILTAITLTIAANVGHSELEKIDELIETSRSEQLDAADSHTGDVVAIDTKTGDLIIDNDDVISTNKLTIKPVLGDTIRYDKTYDYTLKGIPPTYKRLDTPAYFSIQIIEKGENN